MLCTGMICFVKVPFGCTGNWLTRVLLVTYFKPRLSAYDCDVKLTSEQVSHTTAAVPDVCCRDVPSCCRVVQSPNGTNLLLLQNRGHLPSARLWTHKQAVASVAKKCSIHFGHSDPLHSDPSGQYLQLLQMCFVMLMRLVQCWCAGKFPLQWWRVVF